MLARHQQRLEIVSNVTSQVPASDPLDLKLWGWAQPTLSKPSGAPGAGSEVEHHYSGVGGGDYAGTYNCQSSSTLRLRF